MKKNILIISLIISFTGCTSVSSNYARTIAVQSPNEIHDKKYHFIIEKRAETSRHGIDNIFKKFKHITQYHIYTNSLNKVKGNNILVSESKSSKPYNLGANTIFIFDKNEFSIKHMQWCNRLINKCTDSSLNGKYILEDFSLLTKGYKDIKSGGDGHFK